MNITKAHKFLYFSKLSILKISPTKYLFLRVHHLNDRLTSLSKKRGERLIRFSRQVSLRQIESNRNRNSRSNFLHRYKDRHSKHRNSFVHLAPYEYISIFLIESLSVSGPWNKTRKSSHEFSTINISSIHGRGSR